MEQSLEVRALQERARKSSEKKRELKKTIWMDYFIICIIDLNFVPFIYQLNE